MKSETLFGRPELKNQKQPHIIYWKKSYGRNKDKKDLEKYLKNQFIKKNEFEI